MSKLLEKKLKSTSAFFNKFFEMLPRDFSNALGFSKKCILEANALADDLEYDHSAWWNEISDEPVGSKNSIVSIHNPTLRVRAKYLAMVVFSQASLRLCNLEAHVSVCYDKEDSLLTCHGHG